MAGLKPQEIRCLLLKAEGLSYREICTATGWSYTKVNRSLTEGRRSFLKRVAHIESGVECDRLAPLISKVADGEAGAAEMRLVRPHLKNCLACKATLREYRATPSRLAGLVPPVAVLAGGGGGADAGFLARLLQSVQERFAGLGDVAGAKAAAVAASAVVLAGGGAAGVEAIHHDPPPVPSAAFGSAATPAAAAADPAPAAAAPDPIVVATQPASSSPSSPKPVPADTKSTPTATKTASPAAPEFDPGAATPIHAPPLASTQPPAERGPSGGSEFGP
jgi:hypothetical protein